MSNKQGFSFSNISKWPQLFKKLPKREQQAIIMIASCVAVFLVAVIVGTILILGSGGDAQVPENNSTDSSSSSENYDKDENIIDEDEYDGVILQLTTDGGQAYLDDTIFIGDSNTVRINEVYDLVPLENYMGMVGMTVQGASTVPCVFFANDVKIYTIPDAIAKVQPRRVVLTFGTNNADGSTSLDGFIDSYKTLISTIQDKYEYTDIIVSAIPPCGQLRDYPNVDQSTIDAFNSALVEMCEDLDLPFLNISEALKDSGTGYINPTYISSDGLHLNEMGCMTWVSYARTHVLDTEDRRPTVTNVPARQEPPAPVAGTPVPATCTERGYTPYTHWDGTVEQRNFVEPLGHTYENGVCIRCGVTDPNYVPPSSSSSSSSSVVPSSSSSSSVAPAPSSSSVEPAPSSSVTPAPSSSSVEPAPSSSVTPPPSSSEAPAPSSSEAPAPSSSVTPAPSSSEAPSSTVDPAPSTTDPAAPAA